MHWLDMLKVRDLMHAEVVKHDADAPRAGSTQGRATGTRATAPHHDVEPLEIAPEATLRNACGLMIEHDRDRLLVVRHARRLGVLSAMDVVRYLASGAGH